MILELLLGQLRQLCQHTANMAWRVANIIQKMQPKKSLIPEPDDLYRFEVQAFLDATWPAPTCPEIRR